MDYRKLSQQLLKKGRPLCDELEVFLVSKQETTIEYSDENLETFSIAETGGISLRLIKDGRIGFAYSEKLSPDSFDELLASAWRTWEVSPLQEGDRAPQPQDLFCPDDESVTIEPTGNEPFAAADWLACLLQMNQAGHHCSSDVQMMESYGQHSRVTTLIMNSLGLDKQETYEFGLVYTYAILNRAGEMKSGIDFRFFKNLAEVEPAQMAKTAVDRAAETYGAQSVPSGRPKLLLDTRVMTQLLDALEPAFSAENVQKGLSLLQDKLGERIAAANVTIVSDPLSPHSQFHTHFDDEGVPTKFLPLIEKGVLKNYFYDLTRAQRADVTSTGNAGRGYKSQSSPQAFNLTLLPGSLTRDQLLIQLNQGLYITEVQGLHSGLDPISGDFSLPANGFVVRDGVKGRAVNQITIAGNLLDLLHNIEIVGADLEMGMSGTLAPSVLVNHLSVSGEDAKEA